MIKIRTKLLIYFVAILLLTIIFSFVREQSDQRIIDLHEESLDRFFLLNEMTKMTSETFQSLQIYVHEPLPDNLAYYHEDKQQLLLLQQKLTDIEEGSIAKKNYLHMVTTFLEQADQTVDGVRNQNIPQYTTYFNEAEKSSRYIHETTLDIINNELTDYQEVFPLVNEKINHTKKMGTAIFIAIIILSILFAFWFSNGITKTITRLTKAAQEIAAGRYKTADVDVSRKDELWILAKTFNQMKKNILKSVSEIEEKSRLAQLLKEMELRSLQNQINPHFLFNTLNTISKTAYIEGSNRTSELITSVSTLLRYNIGSLDRETLLKDEVEIVREYFFIQSSRFGDRVKFMEHVDSNCLSTPIPCLTLQPIVENAFMHGIEEMDEGAKIELNIYQKGERVCIEVRDNGVGMDELTVERLLDPNDHDEVSLSRKGSGHSTGIGMRNVISRLKLFDKESNVSIISELHKGTTVKIELTKQHEGEMQDD